MVFRSLPSVLVVRQGTEASTDQEWRAFLDVLATQDFSKLKVMIVTDGGSPTVQQRAALKITLAGRTARTAVVSDQFKVRFVVASIALINREHHGFGGHERDKAYEFLGLSLVDRASAEAALKQLAVLVT